MDSDLSKNFNTNGYLIGLDVLTKEETDFYLQSFLEYEKRLGGKVTGIHRFKSHLLLPWMYQLVTHPKILEIVKELFGRFHFFVFTFSKRSFNESLDFFATVHSLVNNTNGIGSCQADLPVQFASNIEFIRQM